MNIRGGSSPRLWLLLIFGLVCACLLTTFFGVFVRDDITRGVYPAVAGVTALYMLAAFGVPFVIHELNLRVKAWIPWVVGGITLAATMGSIALWWLDRWGLGYQWTQSLKIVSAPYGWGDLKLYFQWLSCHANGINPILAADGSCAPNPMDYGPGFLWWTPIHFLSPFADVIGIGTAVISAVAVGWLARNSAPLGALALLFAAVSPAWLLLIERANFDEVIIWLAVFLVVITRRFSGWWPWIVSAILIWILGSWKYYPFGMALALIPALRLRHGWILITTFVATATVYLVANWQFITSGMANHMGRGGGVGRNTLAAFLGGLETASSSLGWPDAIVLILVACAAVWGITVVRSLTMEQKRCSESHAMLAIVGAVTVLGSVTLAGAGWNYKAALLLLGIPLAATLTNNISPIIWRSGITIIALILMANLVSWNPFTSSLSLHICAGFLLGSSMYLLLAQWGRRSLTADRDQREGGQELDHRFH